jgi:hypothetical protein
MHYNVNDQTVLIAHPRLKPAINAENVTLFNRILGIPFSKSQSTFLGKPSCL